MVSKDNHYSKQTHLIFYLFFVIFMLMNFININRGNTMEEKIQKFETFNIQNEIEIYNKVVESDFMQDNLFKKKFEIFLDNSIKIRKIEKIEYPKEVEYLKKSKYANPRDNKMAYINFSLFIQDYLEDKYLDTNGKRFDLNNFLLHQKNMYHDIQKFINITKDSKFVSYIYNNTAIDQNITNFIFAKKYLEENKELKTTVGIKKEIAIDENKEKMKKIIFEFFDSNNNKQMIISTDKKPHGSQFGLVLYEKNTDGDIINKFFLKTHQDGSRENFCSSDMFTSKTLATAKPVNLKELFLYKLLEKINIGAEVSFLVNSFTKNTVNISTKNIDSFVMAGLLNANFSINKDLFDYTKNEIDKENNIVKLKSNSDIQMSIELFEELKSKFTRFDLLNRALCLEDMNEGNYGLVKNTDGNYSIKVVDFRAPNTAKTYKFDEDIFSRSFLNANGYIYKQGGFAKIILEEDEDNKKIILGYKNLDVLNNITDGLLEETYQEIENFAMQIDNISDKQNAEIMGIGNIDKKRKMSNPAIDDLQRYCLDIRSNINMIRTYITKRNLELLENINNEPELNSNKNFLMK